MQSEYDPLVWELKRSKSVVFLRVIFLMIYFNFIYLFLMYLFF